jgi:GH43 family beta-xylosidase
MRPLLHSLIASLLLFAGFWNGTVRADEWFVNPIAEGADPWVVRDPNANRYLWCAATGNQSIAIHTSDTLATMGKRHVIWVAPETGAFSKQVWAPELHFLDGHWHVYFAASDGKNENHLTYVLRSETADPLGEYKIHGPLATGAGKDGLSPNIWAIDMTILEHSGRRYAIWSGWDSPGTDRQFLYIAPMKSPVELSGTRVQLCANDSYPWEMTEPGTAGRGLNEGPEVLDTGKRKFVIYSCAASWLPTYKLGQLELVGDDPLDPKSWVKKSEPVFEGKDEIYGVGHSCFVKSADGDRWWHVFHSKLTPDPGWHRGIFVQPMTIDRTGAPQFGEPQAAGKKLALPN